jgi:hypothetical protein
VLRRIYGLIVVRLREDKDVWKCKNCSEENGDTFDLCWKCQTENKEPLSKISDTAGEFDWEELNRQPVQLQHEKPKTHKSNNDYSPHKTQNNERTEALDTESSGIT